MRFTFDATAIEARDGETIAAALIRAGRPSGYFCGIGACFGCLVTVNGRRAQRACLTPVTEGDAVSPDPMLPAVTTVSTAPPRVAAPDAVATGDAAREEGK